MKKEERALHEIMKNLLDGTMYGIYHDDMRYPYFWENLYLVYSMGKFYIGYNHYGSSAMELSVDNLEWILSTIFEQQPSEFLGSHTTQKRDINEWL